jgi:diguanylate cyclase (GGDEF)-like protein
MDRAHRWMSRWAKAVRAWEFWTLPHWLGAVVVFAVLSDAAAIGVAAETFHLRAHDLTVFGLLVGCIAVTVELTRQVGENKGLIKDVYGAWALPAAFLLPPIYVLIMTIIHYSFLQWRVRKIALYKRAYSAAVVGLSFAAAGLTFRWIYHSRVPEQPTSVIHGLVWCVALITAVLVHTVINKTFMMLALRGSDPLLDIRETFFAREPLYNDLAELCIGALVAYAVATNIFLAPLSLPLVALLQRSLRHAQLLNESRTDAKTGLLNARAWETEAEGEVARAVRARMALAVAVLDIDFFKRVNDTYGHLFGDEVLKQIAHCLPGVLREYDSAGRFGGEEFVLLLPHTRAVDAFRVADRVRDHISGLSPRAPDGQSVQVTVSVGVAALDAGSTRELSELLAAADAALYRAKRDGRNQVQMISTTRGLSASGAPAADTVNAFGNSSPTASVWDVAPGRTPQRSSDADGAAVVALPRR